MVDAKTFPAIKTKVSLQSISGTFFDGVNAATRTAIGVLFLESNMFNKEKRA